MLGEVISFDTNTNQGKILGEDEQSYDFHIGEWLSSRRINIGQKVVYDVEEDEARNIELDEESVLYLKINFRRSERV